MNTCHCRWIQKEIFKCTILCFFMSLFSLYLKAFIFMSSIISVWITESHSCPWWLPLLYMNCLWLRFYLPGSLDVLNNCRGFAKAGAPTWSTPRWQNDGEIGRLPFHCWWFCPRHRAGNYVICCQLKAFAFWRKTF